MWASELFYYSRPTQSTKISGENRGDIKPLQTADLGAGINYLLQADKRQPGDAGLEPVILRL